MATLDANSVDAIVTDPPYGLSFMGKGWDHGVPGVEFWTEALRVAKPGAHLLAFGGTRTYHRLACAIEDAGWEVRDCVMWVYGSGFPKSHDVSKAIDKAAGAEGEYGEPKSAAHAGWIERGRMRAEEGHEGYQRPWMADADSVSKNARQYAPATEAARQWAGWGTALKPAWEPIIVARKPLVGTVAENVLTHGTSGINVDGCRVASSDQIAAVTGKATLCGTRDGYDRPWKHDPAALAARQERANAAIEKANTLGRWPANLIHDGSEEVVGLFPVTTSGSRKAGRHLVAGGQGRYGLFSEGDLPEIVGDSGSAARFFYCAKASRTDREAGLREAERNAYSDFAGTPEHGPKQNVRARNHHPTVKPTALMRYLCRLVTPPGGIVLDPFAGSGSTGKGATLEGFRFIGIEREAEYVGIARARIAAVAADRPLLEATA
jgi:site-specific DNA-methyltransferase (adenine-specific)